MSGRGERHGRQLPALRRALQLQELRALPLYEEPLYGRGPGATPGRDRGAQVLLKPAHLGCYLRAVPLDIHPGHPVAKAMSDAKICK